MSESDGDRTTEEEISDLVGDEIVRDRDERERLLVEIPSNMKDILDKRSDQTGKPKWVIVTEALACAEGGSDLNAIPKIEQAIKREEQKADDLEREAELKLDKAQDRRDRADALRRRKAKIEHKTEARIDALDDVLDTMAGQRMHADIGIGPVPQLAEEWFDGDQTEALSKLKSRAAEIDAEIPSEQFEPPTTTNGVERSGPDPDAELKSLQVSPDADGDDDQNEQEQDQEADPEPVQLRADGGGDDDGGEHR